MCAFFGSVVLWVHQLIEVELDAKNAMAHSNLGVVLEDHEVPNVPMFVEVSTLRVLREKEIHPFLKMCGHFSWVWNVDLLKDDSSFKKF